MLSQRARTTCFFGTAARDATKNLLSVCYKEKKKCLYRLSVSSKARRYPDFIRKNSPNPNEFAQFAFNLLMRPDDHATKSRMTRVPRMWKKLSENSRATATCGTMRTG